MIRGIFTILIRSLYIGLIIYVIYHCYRFASLFIQFIKDFWQILV